ncbi:MAG: preprotein translocase subunit SecG [Terriglobia bacterium]
MSILISIIHILVCLILILVVLLQSGKGADLAGAFGGGGSQTAFGARGTATFLSKLTTGAAIIFMLTSLTLSLITTRDKGSSVMQGAAPPGATGKAPAPPVQNPVVPVQQPNQTQPQSKP